MMIHSRLFVLLAFVLIFAHQTSPVFAAASAWQTSEGGRMRLVAKPAGKDGMVDAALQIEPDAGWITYWREPGGGGIPPVITTVPTSEIQVDAMMFPVPKIIQKNDTQEWGYDAPVTLPLRMKTRFQGATQIKAEVFIGLCKDICVPFQATFELDATSATPDEEALIKAAVQTLPAPPSDNFKINRFSLSDDRKQLTLQITVPDPSTQPLQIAVVGPEGYVYTGIAALHQEGRLVTSEIPIADLPEPYDPRGQTWSALVIHEGRAMEAPLVFP